MLTSDQRLSKAVETFKQRGGRYHLVEYDSENFDIPRWKVDGQNKICPIVIYPGMISTIDQTGDNRSQFSYLGLVMLFSKNYMREDNENCPYVDTLKFDHDNLKNINGEVQKSTKSYYLTLPHGVEMGWDQPTRYHTLQTNSCESSTQFQQNLYEYHNSNLNPYMSFSKRNFFNKHEFFKKKFLQQSSPPDDKKRKELKQDFNEIYWSPVYFNTHRQFLVFSCPSITLNRILENNNWDCSNFTVWDIRLPNPSRYSHLLLQSDNSMELNLKGIDVWNSLSESLFQLEPMDIANLIEAI